MLLVQQTKGGGTQMRFSIKRTLVKKRTPEQAERAYRRMISQREEQKRGAHWQSIAMQLPKMF